MVPTSAFIAFSEIAKAVIDTAIEADTRSPISFIENEPAAAPAPPSRSPQKPTSGAITHVPGTQ